MPNNRQNIAVKKWLHVAHSTPGYIAQKKIESAIYTHKYLVNYKNNYRKSSPNVPWDTTSVQWRLSA